MSPALKKILFSKNVRIAGSVLLGLAMAYLVSFSAPGEEAERSALDLRFRFAAGSRNPDTNIVILTIDQNSLQFFKRTAGIRWPWPRDFYAVLTDYLAAAGAKAIVYDMQFTEPDDDRNAAPGAYNDSLFAASIRNAGNVYLAALLSHREEEDQPGDPLIAVPTQPSDPDPAAEHFDKAYAPLRQFQEAARGVGIVNFTPDADGICRHIRLRFSYSDQLWYPLSFQLYRDLSDGGTAPVTSSDGTYLLYWYGNGGPNGVFPYYSIHSVIVSALKERDGLEPDVPKQRFAGKVVFIGSNAPSLFDLKATPFTAFEPYPGVEIHATALSNFLRKDFITVIPWYWVLGLSFLLSLTVGSVANHSGNIFISTGTLLVAALITVATAWFVFVQQLVLLPVVLPLLSMTFSYIAGTGWSYATEGRNKRRIQRIFGQFVNPHVVQQLSADPDSVEMEGEEVEATVMFSDIEGFTTISESKKPKELVAFLNQYFSTANDIFFKHEGTIDKFIGDAVMVQFGIPLKNPNHRLLAVRAAYEFSRVVYEMNREAREKGLPVFATRIGINSGPMVVGYIGGRSKKEYTVIGDTVNLASRLEGVNKYYGTFLMISETVVTDAVTDEFLLREMDIMRVKGKHQPIRIYEVVRRRSEMEEKDLKLVQTFEAALRLYRDKQWKDAISMFRTAVGLRPDDAASAMYIERCNEFLRTPPPEPWDGVYVMTSK